MSIVIRILGDQVGVGTDDASGNVVVNALDKQANTVVAIEFTPEAWRAFLEAAPRLRGVGIPIAGRAPLYVPGGRNHGEDNAT